MAKPPKTLDKLLPYRAKRDFQKTSEPSGQKQIKPSRGLSYLIQKHAARRLHYDFRLELDGTLKSWAVARGPSLNPTDKRLAVHVEDHPLDYGTFEGTIPEGEYGGGTVMLWDKGTWTPNSDPNADYKKGNMTFELKGKRLKGRWHLVRMGRAAPKGENWLLIKGKDIYADDSGKDILDKQIKSVASGRTMEMIATGKKFSAAKPEAQLAAERPKKESNRKIAKKRKRTVGPSALPDFIEPQLATLVDNPPVGDKWVHELKLDGYRLQAHVAGGEVKLLTRSNNDWTDRFTDIASALASLKVENAILDGEVVHQASDGTMSFHGLQDALSRGTGGLHYFVFDLLFLNGDDLRKDSLLKRKQALASLLPTKSSLLHISDHFLEPGDQVFRHACHMSLEGIVSKRADAPYVSGRDKVWVKSKCSKEQEMVIGGFTVQPKHPDALGALLIGYFNKQKLIFSGKVGTGFSQKEGTALLNKLRAIAVKSSPYSCVPRGIGKDLTWVNPKLVAQIRFAEWTHDGMLRHPSYQGLREDKPARDVKREVPKDVVKVQQESPPEIAKPRTAIKSSASVTVADIAISHPDKIVFPSAHLSKLDLVHYYEKVSNLILTQIAGRPLSLMRCPEGEGKTCFFQRHLGQGASPFIKGVNVKDKGDGEPFVMIEDERGLIALIQMGALEIHAWGTKAAKPDLPDRLVFDLDPAPDVSFSTVKKAALEVRERLQKIKLASFLKMTGGKGLHVVVPFILGPTWEQAKLFSKTFSEVMTRDAPDDFTINSRKVAREGKIFIDYLRNGQGASAIAPYSTRARPGAPIAVPLAWKKLESLTSGNAFTLTSVPSLAPDPWKDMASCRQKLPFISG